MPLSDASAQTGSLADSSFAAVTGSLGNLDASSGPVLPILSGQGSLEPISPSCEIQLQEQLPTPPAKENGTGVGLENQRPDYAQSYVDDPYLHNDVISYRGWRWDAMYADLDSKVKERPDYLDTYRLQADAYQVNSSYGQALSQLDQVLRRSPNDVQALASTSLIQYYLGNHPDYQCRMTHLGFASPQAAKAMQDFIRFAETSMYADYGPQPQTDMKPEAIAVFGQSPNPDGTPSSGMLTRLVKAKEMADRFPDAKIVLSGAAVKTPFAEADVMASWITAQGVDPARIIKDDKARDTVGNAMGMVDVFKQYNLHKILAVGTIQHLPRATTTLLAYANCVGFPIEVDGAGGGDRPDPGTQVNERMYTYVTAARAGGLFEKNDFTPFPHI